MDLWRWLDPRVSEVRVADVQAYLLGHGWKRHPSHSPRTLIFKRVFGDRSKPFTQAIPATEDFSDYPQRIAEFITVLSEIEDRHPVDLLDDILRQPPEAKRQASATGQPRPVVVRDLGAFAEQLYRYGLSLGQWYILSVCGAYGPMPDWGVLGDALALAESVDKVYGPISDTEAEEGLRKCFADGWIRTVDEAGLREIQSILATQGGLGPRRGLPGIGDVDLTVRGAERYRALYKDVHGEYPGWDEAIEEETPFGRSAYCPTLDVAVDLRDSYQNVPGVVAISEPIDIGPWFGSWWQYFPMGYRIDVTCEPSGTQGENWPQ